MRADTELRSRRILARAVAVAIAVALWGGTIAVVVYSTRGMR